MSPIRQSPGSQEGATGDSNGGCTYNQTRQCQKVSIQYSSEQLGTGLTGETPISVKPKRNSEQRKPRGITLKELFELFRFEGDTVASTASYMLEVEVTRMGQRAPQVDGYLVEIPVRELDDPPDGSDDEAASL